MTHMPHHTSDVLILGAGPAGLAAATALSRQKVKTTIFDSGVYRNAPTKHMHNVPGFDHVHPSEYRAASRKELTQGRYKTNTFVDKAVKDLKKIDGGFEATDSAGVKHMAKKVILANGIRDIHPDIAGYGDCWGRSIFHCLFCHGYEESGSTKAGLLTQGALAAPQYASAVAGMAKRLVEEVTLFTDGDEKVGHSLEAAIPLTPIRVNIDTRRILRLEHLDVDADERLAVHFAEGTEERLGFMVHIPDHEVNVPESWRQDLGLELDEMRNLKVDKMGESTCPGIFAAGDATTMMTAVPTALYTGMVAAAAIVHQIVLGH